MTAGSTSYLFLDHCRCLSFVEWLHPQETTLASLQRFESSAAALGINLWRMPNSCATTCHKRIQKCVVRFFTGDALGSCLAKHHLPGTSNPSASLRWPQTQKAHKEVRKATEYSCDCCRIKRPNTLTISVYRKQPVLFLQHLGTVQVFPQAGPLDHSFWLHESGESWNSWNRKCTLRQHSNLEGWLQILVIVDLNRWWHSCDSSQLFSPKAGWAPCIVTDTISWNMIHQSAYILISYIYIYIHIIIRTYANVHWGKVAQQIRVIPDRTVAKTLSCYFSNLLPPWLAVHTAHFLRTTHLITKITRYLYCMIILCTFYCVYICVCVSWYMSWVCTEGVTNAQPGCYSSWLLATARKVESQLWLWDASRFRAKRR